MTRKAGILGHPVHVMLIHFPIALWPAHFGLHLFAGFLPAQVSAIAGFWTLAAGVALGWLAAAFGAWDLASLSPESERDKFNAAITHAVVNGIVLVGFTVFAGYEWSRYPVIQHSAVFLVGEGALLAAMMVGNYFGGAVVWRDSSRSTQG